MGKNGKREHARRKPLVEELEARLLFSADAAALVAPVEMLLPADAGSSEAIHVDHEAPAGSSVGAEVDARRELVFVDAGVEGYEALVEDLRGQSGGQRQLEVVVLDPDHNGIEQIGEALGSHRHDLDAVHIVSHGSDGAVQLGDALLSSENIAHYAEAIAGWGSALGAEADLLFYGCDLVAGSEGVSLVDSLAALTGADVAASTDATGHALLGGDWDLEVLTGQVEAKNPFSAELRADWSYLLAGDITSNLAVHLAFDDGSGTTATDSSGNGNDAGLSGTQTWTGGNLGGGFRFDYTGGDDYFEIPNSPTVENVQEGDYTLAAWVRAESTPPGSGSDNDAQYGIIVKEGYHAGLSYNNANRFQFDHVLTGDVPIAVLSTNTFAPGQFHHVATVVDRAAGTLKMYVDGVLEGTTAFTPGTGAREYGTDTWKVGMGGQPGWGTWKWAADATIDDARIYGRALTAVDVQALANLRTTDFQEGSGGYTGTADTRVTEDNPAANQGADTTLRVDLSAGTSDQGLIRFDNIFGWGPGLIPPGSTIDSASLTVEVSNATLSTTTLALHRMHTTWNESATWTGTGGGIQLDDLEASSTADSALASPSTAGAVTFEGLEARLQAWLDGDANFGWAIVSDSSDGWVMHTSEHGTVSTRPILNVEFTPPAPASVGLWLTTEEDVASPSGAPGLASWAGGEVLEFGGTPTFEPGTTSGTFTSAFELDDFIQDGDTRVDSIHYVGTTMTVGSNAVPLQAGDALVSTVFWETMVNSDTSTVPVTSRDVFIYRPDTAGDYAGGGTFIPLIVGLDLSIEIEGISLVEQSVAVGVGGGATTLNAGDFIYTDRDDTGKIFRFQPGVLGGAATNTGTISVLADVNDLGVAQNIHGVELVESTVTLGDRTLSAGQILISTYADDTVSGTPVKREDIVILDIVDTGATTTGTAEVLFEGAEVGLDTWQESIFGISLLSSNAAPVLTPGTPTLTPINEDALTNGGDLVSAIIVGTVADGDLDPVGIAITATANGGGTWQYSTDGGGAWLAVGTVDASNSLLLRPADLLRFVPDGDNGESPDPTVTYRAWDQTAGTFGTKVVTTGNGGTTAYSSALDTASIGVASVNDAPSLSVSTLFAAISEDDITNTGNTVDSLIAGGSSDVDTGAVKGVAITGTNDTNGTWQYTLDGSTWLGVGAVTPTSARLLPADGVARVRFVPNANYNGVVSPFSYKAWDRTSGSPGGLGNASGGGGTSAFSTGTSGTSITVTAVNDAPTLGNGSLAAVNEDATSPPGATISSLFGGGFGDIDAGSSFAGVAIVGNTAPGTEGVWQYSSDGGTTWAAVGTVTDGATALAIQSTSLLRFLPAADYNGTPTDLVLRGLDNSYGGSWSTTPGVESRINVDTTTPGGITPITAATSTLDTSVNALNDAPTLGNGSLAAVNEDATNPPGATVSALFGGGFGDIDAGSSFAGVAIVGNTAPGTEGVWQYSSDGGTTWAAVGTVTDGATALAIQSTSLLRFLPAADYNGTPTDLVLRGLDNSYGGSWSTTPGVESRINVDTTTRGGITPIAAATSALSTSVAAVNDAPVLSAASNFAAIAEDDFTNAGKLIDTFVDTEVSDVDSGALKGIAIWSSDETNGIWEYTLDGSTWLGVGSVSSGAARLLPADGVARVRFVPNADYNGSIPFGIYYRGWDQTVGTPGGLAAIVPTSTGAFSITSSSASIDVTAVNDAPTLGNGSLTAVNEDATSPPGATISALFGGGFGDIDAGSSFAGVAIVGNTAPGTEGVWQYSSDGGTTWAAVGTVADDATALAVQTTSLLRFLPAADYNGTPTDLVLRGLDNSYGGGWSTTPGIESRINVDTTTPGGITPIAAATSNLSTSINAVNDAPTLGNGSLAAVNEDATNPPGATISALFGGGFGDIDAGSSFVGVAIVGNTTPGSEGIWQYSSDAGTTWAAVGTVADDATALAVQTSSLLRFLPAADYDGTPTDLVLRGLDDTYGGSWSTTPGVESRINVDTTTPGGITPIAAATSTLSTSINAVNDAPTLGNGSLAAVLEDTTNPPGATISSLFGAGFGDVDAGSSFSGVAIVGNTAPGSEGVWEYSSDGGTNWFAVGTVSDGTTALAVQATSLLRFVPAGGYNGIPTDLVLRGLDDTYGGSWSTTGAGETRITVDTTTPGGVTPIAGATSALSTSITVVNDAPTLGNGALAAVAEDTTSPPGATITSLFGGSFSDPDTGAFLSGVAIVGNSAPGSEGAWQYSSDGGTTWAAVGTVADDATALAVQTSSLLRFLPAADYNGTPTDLVLRGLDDTYGGSWSTTPGVESRINVDTTTPGGSTPIAAATSTLSTSINAVNDAPTLGNGALAPIAEDATNPPGATISSLFGGSFGDVDAGSSFAGVAIVGNTAPGSEGVWEYSSDGGSTWFAVGTVADGATALAVQSTSLLRFHAAGDYEGTPTDLVVRGLDDSYAGSWSTTGGGETRITVDTSTPGGATAIAGATSSLSTLISPVNDAPVLSGPSPITAISEDDVTNTGQLVDVFVDTEATDVDAGAVKGIAVLGTDEANGTWEYTLDGSTWLGMGTVTPTSARLLPADGVARVRFVPDPDFNGTVTPFSYRAWDQGLHAPGSLADASSGGGITIFSSASATTSLTVNAVNDAPTLGNGSLAAANEDATNPPGATISSLFGASFGDVDAGSSFAGVAIVGNTAPGTEGVWQYSSDGGTNWFAVGSVADGATALAIQASSLLRFVPAVDYNGTPTDLVLRGLDDSYGGSWSTTGAGETRIAVDTSISGGTTPITAAISALSTSVTPVNDAPTLGNGTLAAVAEDTASPPGATIATLLGAGFGDIDAGSSFSGIAIVANAAPLAEGVWQYSSDAGANWFAVGTVADGPTALAVQATSLLRFVPAADYNGTPTNLVLRGLDNSYAGAWSTTTGGTETRVPIDTTTPGTTTPIAAATSTLGTSITAVNDAPTLGNGTLAAVAEDTASPPGATIATLLGAGFGDIDAGSSFSGIAIVANAAPLAEGVWQYSSDAGANWFAVGTVADGPTALAVQATSLLRFVPAADYNGTPTNLVLRGLDNSYAGAWSTTTGGTETRVPIDTTTPGTTTPIAAATSTLGTSVTAVNDAPTLGNGTLAAVAEDTASPPGAMISALLGGVFGDIDAGSSFAGIAVTGNAANPVTQGAWQYSSDGGTNWYAVGTVADGPTALAIQATSLLRFVPVADYNGTPTDLVLRGLDNSYAGAWSTTSAGETRIAVDTTTPGTTTPIALATSTLATSINAVNDAPTLGNGTLAAVAEDTASPPGAAISALLGAGFADIDAGSSFAGIAIVANAAPLAEGVWQYSSDAGANWFAVGTVTDGPTALAVQATSLLRFVPAASYNGTPTDLVLRGLDNSYAGAWSTTTGGTETRVPVDTTTPGTTTPIAAATSTLGTSVNAVNDAPTLGNGTLAAVNEDTLSPPGASITSLLGGTFADIDAGSSFAGIAIVGNAALPAQGAWQYSSDAGANWFAVGAVADGPTALAVQATSLLRFVPAADYAGTPTALSLRGLDDSYAGAWSTTTGGTETRVPIDTTTPGTPTPIAAATSTVGTSITPVNDAPSIGGISPALFTNDKATIAPFSSVVIGDVDTPADILTVDVSLDLAAKGVLSGGGFTPLGGGVYRFVGNASAATLAIQALSFDPTENRVPVGSSELTTFTISVDDATAPAVLNSATTVSTLSINDPPTLTGGSFSVVEHSLLGTAIGSVVNGDPDPGDSAIYSIIAGDPGGILSIDASGTIRVAIPAALDAILTPSFALTVQVMDGALTADTAAVMVTVNASLVPPVIPPGGPPPVVVIPPGPGPLPIIPPKPAPNPLPGPIGGGPGPVPLVDGVLPSVVFEAPRHPDDAAPERERRDRPRLEIASAPERVVEEPPLVLDDAMLRALDLLGIEMDDSHFEDEAMRRWLGSVGEIGSIGMVAGFLAWFLRGGTLLTSVLSTLPLWSRMDPLPVLSGANAAAPDDEDEDEDDEQERRAAAVLDERPGSGDGGRA